MKFNTLPRSESCPDLTIYRSSSPIPCRKRAYSECFPGETIERSGNLSTFTLNRVQSDTDLDKIDRKRTFEGVSAIVQPGELLARVVTALGSMRPIEDDGQSVLELANNANGGFHGFSDEEILASERTWSGWSLPTSEKSSTMPYSKHRERAASDVRMPAHNPEQVSFLSFFKLKTEYLFFNFFTGSTRMDMERIKYTNQRINASSSTGSKE